jgi:hypothetical protein
MGIVLKNVNITGGKLSNTPIISDISTFTCDQIKAGFTDNQKICVRNAAFFSYQDEIPAASVLPINTTGAAGFIIGNAKMLYDPVSDRYFVLRRPASNYITVFNSDFSINTLSLTPIATNRTIIDIAIDNGFLYMSHSGATDNVWKIDCTTLTAVILATRVNRAAGMLIIGDDIYTPRGLAANTQTNLSRINKNTGVETVLNATTSTAGVDFTPGYDGTDIICTHGTNTTSVSFYSISGNNVLATVNLLTGGTIGGGVLNHCFYFSSFWWIVHSSGIIKIDPSTYSILENYSLSSLNNFATRSIVHEDRYIVTGGWQSGRYTVFDTVTERFFSTGYNAIPFIDKNNKLSGIGINTTLYPNEGVYIFTDLSL